MNIDQLNPLLNNIPPEELNFEKSYLDLKIEKLKIKKK